MIQLDDVQVKSLAAKARAELTDEQVVQAYLSGGATRSVDVPPDSGKKARKAAPKRTAKVTTVAKAQTKRERGTFAESGVDRVEADIKANPGTGVAGILERTGLERNVVGSALQALKKRKSVEGRGSTKRDQKYFHIGAS